MRLYYTSPKGEGEACTRPDLSLGGFKSSTVCPNNSFSNLFADISYYSIAENNEEFIALILVNETELDLKNVTLYLTYPVSCQKTIEVAPIALSTDNEMEVVLTPYNAPYNATFYDITDIGNAIDIGDIPIDGRIGIWFKRIINKDVIDIEYSDDSIEANGTPTVSNEEIILNISWIHLPILTTTVASNITDTTADSGGNITSDGDDNITAKGVCWSTSQNPTIADSLTSDGIGIGIFTSNITGLTAGTTYYMRAYTTNSLGTSYGDEVSFVTLP